MLDAPVGQRDGGALIQTNTGAAGGGWTRVEDAGWCADALGEGWRTDPLDAEMMLGGALDL